MKKFFTVGVIILSIVSLSGCTSKNESSSIKEKTAEKSSSSTTSESHISSSISSSEEASSSQETASSTLEESSLSTTTDADVNSLLNEYDSFIQKIKETSEKVSGMSDIESMNAITDLVQEQAKITSKYDDIKDTNLTSEESTELMNKSVDMLQEYDTLMSKLNA